AAASPLLPGNRGGGDERDAAIPPNCSSRFRSIWTGSYYRCAVDFCRAQHLRLFRSACGASSGAVYMEKARLRAFQREQATAKTSLRRIFSR
ncbi:Os01g0958800, partial [Oryza sativa Japonica Group]